MNAFLIETAALIAIAYVLGCVGGMLARKLFGNA